MGETTASATGDCEAQRYTYVHTHMQYHVSIQQYYKEKTTDSGYMLQKVSGT